MTDFNFVIRSFLSAIAQGYAVDERTPQPGSGGEM
jgi:hypothetical protein